MGVKGLLKCCKQGASREVILGRGGPGSAIIIDGCFLLHRHVSDQGVAAALHQDDVGPLAQACVRLVRLLMDAEWTVVVVFDGDSPPAKEGTRIARRGAREKARARMEAATTALDRDKAAKQCVSLGERVIARVSGIISRSCGCETITAPFEADAQLVTLEQTMSESYNRTYIYANDSDLLVLGAQCLLYELKTNSNRQGLISGSVIEREKLLRPSRELLADDKQGEFLRQLHGVPRRCSSPTLLPPEVVDAKLVDLACLAGNDYFKYRGVGIGVASDIALRGSANVLRGSAATIKALSARMRAKGRSGALTDEEMEANISVSRLMFLHSVVWDLHTGQQRRMTPLEDRSPAAEALATASTGAVETDPDVCRGIADGSFSPTTKKAWAPGLPQDGILVRGGKRARAVASATEPRTRTRPANAQPDPTTAPLVDDFDRMHIAPLRALASGYRCVEKSGVGALRKAELVALLKDLTAMADNLPTVEDRHLYREPARDEAPQERLQRNMAGIPDEHLWISDHLKLRGKLPELSESVIIAYLSAGGAVSGDEMSRNLYRGVQRAMDLGGLDGLSAVLPPDTGGVLWLRLRVKASMRTSMYSVYARLQVLRIATTGDIDGQQANPADDGPRFARDTTAPRLVATRVLSAYCECKSGADGLCHHIAMTLQLSRLLQMSEREIDEFLPPTVTSVQCQWILNHIKGGREAETNMWWGRTLTDVAAEYCTMRDPKGQEFGLDMETRLGTQGVVQGDRAAFNPHPALGDWALARSHFDKGTTISSSQNAAFGVFFDAVKASKKREKRGADQSADREVPLAVEVLPPLVRRDEEHPR